LPEDVDVLIAPKDSDVSELSAGIIRLLTNNGRVCGEDGEPDCSGSIGELSSGGITIDFGEMNPTTTFSALYEARNYISILKGHRLQGDKISSVSSLSPSGKAFVANLPYGAYTVLVREPNYYPAAAFVDLQAPSVEISMTLLPTLGDHDMGVSARIDSTVDFDLMLEVQRQERQLRGQSLQQILWLLDEAQRRRPQGRQRSYLDQEAGRRQLHGLPSAVTPLQRGLQVCPRCGQ
jgi:hypothetical protein